MPWPTVSMAFETYYWSTSLMSKAVESHPEAEPLRAQIDQLFECTWLPIGPMSLVLGAHTGPSMVGVAFGSQTAFADVP